MHLTPGFFHRVWFGGLLAWLLFEITALVYRGTNDTFSEWTWSKIHTAPVRMLVGTVLTWMLWHFLFSGPNRGLSWRDAVAAALGLGIGYFSFLWSLRWAIR